MNRNSVPAGLSTESSSRREFVVNLIMTFGSLLGLGSLAGRFVQFFYPVIPPVRLLEVKAAKIKDIPAGSVRAVNLPQGNVMIVNNGGQVTAFSAVCTHLACLVRWEENQKRFHCPCHHGMFDINGKVISGPPPRPLDEIKATVRGEDIVLFMKGTEEKA